MPPRSPAHLEDHLGYWLRHVSNHVSHAFARRVEAQGVTVAEWVVLRSLFEPREGLAPSEIASALGMTRGAISKLVDRLLAKGLATREGDPDDARRQRVALTPTGRALVPRLARLADENDRAFFGSLSQAERAALLDTLKHLAAANTLGGTPVD